MIYQGTAKGSGTIHDGAIPIQVTFTDVVTENIAINIADSTFSGTEQQAITLKITAPFGVFTSTFSTTLSGPISGLVNSANVISTTISGQPLTVTATFSPDYRDIFLSGSGSINLSGFSGSLTAGGTAVVSGGVVLDIDGGFALSGYTVSSGVTLRVLSGGTDISATISNGGAVLVTSGGKDSGTTILKGGFRYSDLGMQMDRPGRHPRGSV